jgi:hypothetical protein
MKKKVEGGQIIGGRRGDRAEKELEERREQKWTWREQEIMRRRIG